MSRSEEPRPAEAKASQGKQEYEKPRILFREPFHAFAALCNPGKGEGQPDDCQNIVAS